MVLSQTKIIEEFSFLNLLAMNMPLDFHIWRSLVTFCQSNLFAVYNFFIINFFAILLMVSYSLLKMTDMNFMMASLTVLESKPNVFIIRYPNGVLLDRRTFSYVHRRLVETWNVRSVKTPEIEKNVLKRVRSRFDNPTTF